MADAKQLIAERLRAAHSTPAAPAPLNGHADPTLLSGASEYLATITRSDRSTLGPRGNRALDLGAIATRKRLNFAERDAVSPLGRSEAGGFYL